VKVSPLTVSQIGHAFGFVVEIPNKRLFFRAKDRDEHKEWLDVLGAVLFKVREAKLKAIQASRNDNDDDSSDVTDATLVDSSDDE